LIATQDTLTELLREVGRAPELPGEQRTFAGIALAPTSFAGRVHKGHDLVEALRDGPALGPEVVLVVPALEPSWAVLFGRVGGVVAEVGGEMSHASILLREARKPAIVNATGIFARVRDGDRVRLDGRRGVVEVVGIASPVDREGPQA
jgi:pyruvate,water dikinase